MHSNLHGILNASGASSSNSATLSNSCPKRGRGAARIENTVKKKQTISPAVYEKVLEGITLCSTSAQYRNLLVDQCNKRCRCKKSKESSCILAHFNNSYDAAGSFIEYCRKLGAGKTIEEYEAYLLHKFQQCVVNKKEIAQEYSNWKQRNRSTHCFNLSQLKDALPEFPASEVKLKLDFTLCNEGTIFKPFKPCVVVWTICFGFTQYQIDLASLRLRRLGGEVPLQLSSDLYDHHTQHDIGMTDGIEILKEACFESIHDGVIRSQDSWENAAQWMKTHFEVYGDLEPTVNEIHLELQEKKEIYDMYVSEINQFLGDACPILDYTRWLQLWATAFSHVKIREYKQVNGKCFTCYYINDGRRHATNRVQLDVYKKLHFLHKAGMFGAERLAYKARRDLALSCTDRGKVCSIILDGMDQSHSKIPNLGKNATCHSAIPQHITGILEHTNRIIDEKNGRSGNLYLYRNFPHVKKSANLSIHCLSHHLFSWKARYDKFPEELYIQFDGGGENANSTIMAYLEWLVAMRAVKLIVYSRIPTGHTHEDIDRCFSVFWNHFSGRSVHTQEEYKSMMYDAYADRGTYKVEVIDVHCVADYESWFKPCHGRMERLHKMELTQHQFRFEAVESSNFFPLGVKVTYRAYSCDKVIEIYKKPSIACKSHYGQATGLEPVLRYCKWFPSDKCIMGRPVEGEWFLKSLPPRINASLAIPLPLQPAEFATNTAISYKNLHGELGARVYCITAGPDSLDSWRKMAWDTAFQDLFPRYLECPAPECVKFESPQEYCLRRGLGVPARNLMAQTPAALTASWTSQSNLVFISPSLSIDWPIPIVFSQASVVSENNPHARPTTVEQPMDPHRATLLQQYCTASRSYYIYLNTQSVKTLKLMRKRRMDDQGRALPSSMTKNQLLHAIETEDQDVFTARFSKLSAEDLQTVSRAADPTVLNQTEVVATIDTFSVTRDMIQGLSGMNIVGRALMAAFLKLFEARDRMVNSALLTTSRVSRQPSFYVPPEQLIERGLAPGSGPALLSDGSILQYLRVFMPMKRNDSWVLVIIDIVARKITYFDPLVAVNSVALPGDVIEFGAAMKIQLRAAQQAVQVPPVVVVDENDWPIARHGSDYYPPAGHQPPFAAVETLSDAGLCVLLAIELIDHDMPIIYELASLSDLRDNFCFWLLKGTLPL